MLLVVDVGNSNIVFGVFDGDTLVHQWRIETRTGCTSDEYGVIVDQFCQRSDLSPSQLTHMIISCVVPPLVTPMLQVGREYLNCKEVLVVGDGIRTGMPIRTENPREVGADRIVNAVAAYEHVEHKSGVIVCDFGTATTFDVVSPAGEYLGGAIAPGVGISLDALFHQAAKLPRIELVRPPSVIGRNTITSMQSGIVYGYIGLVDGLVERMMNELPFTPRVIATGGVADLIAVESARVDEVHPTLTLCGLQVLFTRNSS
jgi:type III pantothenate kinase